MSVKKFWIWKIELIDSNIYTVAVVVCYAKDNCSKPGFRLRGNNKSVI